VPQALRIAAEADIMPIVVGDAGGILGYGLTRRTASPGQRRALAARDRGCSFPGCDRPPDWCETHHVIPWVDGGRTDLHNLTLVRLSREWRGCGVCWRVRVSIRCGCESAVRGCGSAVVDAAVGAGVAA